jgi:hypothetical protein
MGHLIASRPFVVLAWSLLALVLLAGAPSAALEHGYEARGAGPGKVSSRALGHEGRGHSDDLVAASADRAEDSPDPHALLCAPFAVAAAPAARDSVHPAVTRVPLSHWPLAGLPTGPPKH